MFKNEEIIMDEWFNHYISQGIEHFYLIDNGSTDNYKNILNKYLNVVTIVLDDTRDNYETQTLLFNKHYLDLIKQQSEWIIVCDMDEYIYSRKHYKTLHDYIVDIPENINSIVLPWKNFGNNDVVEQPNSIISTFLKCEDPEFFKNRILSSGCNIMGHCKSITRTSSILRIGTHECALYNNNQCHFSDLTTPIDLTIYNIDNQYIHLNHYPHMSYDYYLNVKMKRQCAQTNNTESYNLARFNTEKSFFSTTINRELYDKSIVF